MLKNYLGIFIIFLLAGCENENPISSDIEQMQFPMNIGTSWDYDITDTTYYYSFGDSVQINNGLLSVKIVSSIVLGNGKKTFIWEYSFQNNIDSIYVLSSGDSIFFYQDKKYPVPKTTLVFPLILNKEWQQNECDKYRVVSTDTLNLPIGLTKDVVRVEQYYSCEGEASALNTYHIKQNIGIVKYRSNYMNAHYSTGRNKEWNLKSYSVN